MINKELEERIECLKFTRGVMKAEAHNRKITELNIAHGGLDVAYDWRKMCWHFVPELIEEVEFLDRVVQELHDEREAAVAVLRLERKNRHLVEVVNELVKECKDHDTDYDHVTRPHVFGRAMSALQGS